MASYVTLNNVKKHLNIENEVYNDDMYLEHLIEVAEATVERHICQPLEGLEDSNGDLSKPLEHAILLYIGDLYANRESVAFGGSPQKVPFTYEYLVSLYQNYKAE